MTSCNGMASAVIRVYIRIESYHRKEADRLMLRHLIAGLPAVSISPASFASTALVEAAARRATVFVFVNAYSAMLRRQEPAYAALLDDEIVVPVADGASLTLGARLLGTRIERCPGPDALSELARAAAVEGTRLFLLGGAPGVVETLAATLASQFPGLRIAGTLSPPYGEWSDATTDALIDQVRTSGADLLVVGVSAPKQETWSVQHVERIGMPVVCVGAAFDFLSGAKPRAPRLVRSLGLEWLFRLLTEPGRLWKRYLVGNTVFLVDLIRYGARALPPDQQS